MTIFMARIRMYKRCLRGPEQLLYCGPFCYTNGLLDLPLLVLCRPNSKLCVLHVVCITIIRKPLVMLIHVFKILSSFSLLF